MRIFDWHCDSIIDNVMFFDQTLAKNDGQVDLPRLQAGGAFVQLFALFGFHEPRGYKGHGDDPYQGKLYTPWEHVQLQYDVFCREMNAFSDKIALATCVSDILENEKMGKISALLSLEGGIPTEGKMERIDVLYDMGVRLITLTWNYETPFGFPNSKDPDIMSRGLKPFGIEAIERMNELGILIDVSHLSDGGFYDVAKYSKKPFIASHSCCRALCDHPRCMTDDMLKAIGDAGGVVGVNFYSYFLNEGCEYTSIDDVVRHARHIADKAGIEALAFGSDFDGIQGSILEFEDYAGMPRILQAMEKYFTPAQMQLICRENSMRIFRDVVG